MAAVEADVLGMGTAGRGDNGVMVTTSQGARDLAADGSGNAQGGGNAVNNLLKQPLARKILPWASIVLVVLLGVIVFSSLTKAPPRALYPEMADTDKQEAQQVLLKNGIGVDVDRLTGALQVSPADFHEARIVLAAAGLPRQTSTGMASITENMPLGTSQFMEQARYNASIEEELSLSIRRINSVQDARVHLALPRQSPFVRERAEPKASVIVTPFAGRALSDGQVQAIVHLVSSSIPYLTPTNVSVVDQFGRLLTESADGTDLNAKQLALRQKMEADFADRVVQLLAPIYGVSNVRVQATTELDFSIIEQTEENFDPVNAGTRVRSEQSSLSTSSEPRAEGVPGSLANAAPDGTVAVPEANLPPGADAAAQNQTRTEERSESRNFEMDRSVRYVVDPAPRLRRLSVAVAINDAIAAPGATEAPQRNPLPDEEIQRLTNLVQGAVGFSADRGDQVTLISTSFEPPQPVIALPIWERPEYIELTQYIAITIAIMLLGFLVVRPVIARLTYVEPPPPSEEQIRQLLAQQGFTFDESGKISFAGMMGEGGAGDFDEGLELQEGETLEQLKARLKPKKKGGISAEMLDTANSYDDKVTVVRMMVEQDARRVALVLKNLITKDI
jgi:flagellar M-ring protein FliF